MKFQVIELLEGSRHDNNYFQKFFVNDFGSGLFNSVSSDSAASLLVGDKSVLQAKHLAVLIAGGWVTWWLVFIYPLFVWFE